MINWSERFEEFKEALKVDLGDSFNKLLDMETTMLDNGTIDNPNDDYIKLLHEVNEMQTLYNQLMNIN